MNPSLIGMYQINENVIEEMFFIRKGFYNQTKKMKDLVTIGVEILLVY